MHRGEPISFKQEDLEIKGHAIELRVYAEDPANNFLPDIGTLQTYVTPKGPGVRVDDGFEQGMEIPIYYDPMIAKLITYGKDRTEAIERMVRAIDEYDITGITTTLGFGKFVMQHEAFTSGNFDTHFVKKYFTPEVLQRQQRGRGDDSGDSDGAITGKEKCGSGGTITGKCHISLVEE